MRKTSKQTSERRGVFARRAAGLAGSACVLFAASTAGAQQQRTGDFGEQGQFIISGDRLFQLFAFDSVSSDNLALGGAAAGVTSQTTTSTSTSMSFFYGSNGNAIGASGNITDAFFTVPRVGLDYVIVPNVTLGGDLIVLFTLGGSTKNETDYANGSNTTASTENPSVTGFGIAPRGGYILGLTDQFSLWLRGGFSYYTATVKTSTTTGGTTTTDSVNLNQFALDLEPQIVFTPVPHVGFTAGLTADVPLAGGHSEDATTGGNSESASAHSSIFYLGLELGMLAHF